MSTGITSTTGNITTTHEATRIDRDHYRKALDHAMNLVQGLRKAHEEQDELLKVAVALMEEFRERNAAISLENEELRASLENARDEIDALQTKQ